MKLENQVVSLELSKRLKELGVKQESIWVWAKSRQTALPDLCILRKFDVEVNNTEQPNAFQYDIFASAFTVAELGEMLPRYIVHNGLSCELSIVRSSIWRLYYGKEIYLSAATDDTEADARAKMLIYLLENKLITL